ncbi:MAG: ankyrin repeat domain-containing protein [Planctomycetia bacterium]|nr:ankyrin repeat domain-containing protein [Planctomycetia bacterium]
MAKKKLTLEKWFKNCAGWEQGRDLATLRAGIKAGFLNEQDEDGMTALYYAALEGWLEGVEQLLRAGADTELRHHRTGATVLLSAVQNGTDAVIEALLAAGANVDAGNHFGLTPREWRRLSDPNPFPHIRKKRVTMPEPRIQNAEHLADHHWPSFKIPDREERETLEVGTAVNLYVYGPRGKGKQDTVKVRITARSGRRPNVRYTATVETPLKQTHLPRGTTEIEFGPENIATVYVTRKK